MSLNNYGPGAITLGCSWDSQKLREEESCCSSSSLKRQREDGRDLDDYSKSQRLSKWYIFVPENQPVSSEDESVYSFQGWETEFCQDTPDTSSDSSVDSDPERDDPALEFDVASLPSEAENPFGRIRCSSSDSSTDNDDNIKLPRIVTEVKEDKAYWGDDSNADSNTSSSDQEITGRDYWTCLRCKCVNIPIPRYCSKCFLIRKTWFPPRPRPHKPRKKSNGSQRKWKKFDAAGSKVRVDSDSECLSSMDSMEYSVNPKSESVSSMFNSEWSKECEDDSQITNVVSALNNDKCITCMERPKNAVFVHRTIGHLCCCYQCARKVWSNSGKCPVCNRKANCFVKTFVA
ncbi:hypothetical protein J437_LFUL008523 [Ladona fulva]|uniref:RanBP2-type domain-containing protein n=1 Tax=Ladona fulva TaxID=123851 RepID=A0A8K0JWG6_LADFU|nr:hypothetical protein J437_LFUL008523 [Ladona fulva]